jgi:hypothetical protein
MVRPRASFFALPALAAPAALAWFALSATDTVAEAPKRTENVSIQILATSNNNGEVEECG